MCVRVCARWSVCVSLGGVLCEGGGGYLTYRFVELKNLGYLQRAVLKQSTPLGTVNKNQKPREQSLRTTEGARGCDTSAVRQGSIWQSGPRAQPCISTF